LTGVGLRDTKMDDAIFCKTLMTWGEDNSDCNK